MMSKKNLKQLEKWQSFCMLKGIDVIEEQYEICEVNNLLDQLESYIQENEACYRAAIESRKMGLTGDDLNWYSEYLEEQEQEKESKRRDAAEAENPVLNSLEEKNDFRSIVQSFSKERYRINVDHNKEPIQVSFDVIDDSYARWKVEFSWYDKNLSMTKRQEWKPLKNSIKCPDWFPYHWKNNSIKKPNHMAAYVAWKLVNGRGKDMGVSSKPTKLTTKMTAVEDLKELTTSAGVKV